MRSFALHIWNPFIENNSFLHYRSGKIKSLIPLRGGKVNRNFTENRTQLKRKGLFGEHKTRQINKVRPVLTCKSILMWGKKMDIKICYWFWRDSYTQVTEVACMWEIHDKNLLDMALFSFSSEKILTWLWDNTYFIAIENSVFFLKQRRKKAFFNPLFHS